MTTIPAPAPLVGQRIVVTRPKDSSTELIKELRARGARPIELPTIRFGPPTDPERFQSSLDQLEPYDWLLFTSATGVHASVEAMTNRRGSLKLPPRLKLGAVGPATRDALTHHGLATHFVPTRYLTDSLGQELPNVRGRRILLLRAEKASTELPRILTRRGARVDDVAAYTTIPDPAAQAAASALARDASPDWILFTSPSTVEHFVGLFGPEDLARLERARVACIGPVTAAAARQHGFQVTIEAADHTIPGLVRALEEQVIRDA